MATDRPSGTHKFGWCMTGYHKACIIRFYSEQTGKHYFCHCWCHKHLEETMKELV